MLHAALLIASRRHATPRHLIVAETDLVMNVIDCRLEAPGPRESAPHSTCWRGRSHGGATAEPQRLIPKNSATRCLSRTSVRRSP